MGLCLYIYDTIKVNSKTIELTIPTSCFFLDSLWFRKKEIKMEKVKKRMTQKKQSERKKKERKREREKKERQKIKKERREKIETKKD